MRIFGAQGADHRLQPVELRVQVRLFEGPGGVHVVVVDDDLGDVEGHDGLDVEGHDGLDGNPLAVQVGLVHRQRAGKALRLLGEVGKRASSSYRGRTARAAISSLRAFCDA